MGLKEAAERALEYTVSRRRPKELPLPPELRPLEPGLTGTTYGQAAEQLLLEGKPVLLAGLSLIGDAGYISPTIGILQATAFVEGDIEHIKGWNYFVNNPEGKYNKLKYIDTQSNKLTALGVPNTMVSFAAEVPSQLVDRKTDKKRLKAVVAYALTQVHD